MVTTEINIMPALARFFTRITLPDTALDRQNLLLLFWEPLANQLPLEQKLAVYHCFNAYEKAYVEFAAGNQHLAQNLLDYADYHAYELSGQPREGLDIARHLAMALYHNATGQFENAFAELEQSRRLLSSYGPEACLLQTTQDVLYSDVQYGAGQMAAACDTAAGLLNRWAFNPVEAPFADLLPGRHRIAFIHYVTNAALHNVHDWLYENEPARNTQMEILFRGASCPAAADCPVTGYQEVALLLARYEEPCDEAFVQAVLQLLPVLPGIPVFAQYFLLRKLTAALEQTDHPDWPAMRNTLQRYYAYIGVTSLLNTKNSI